MGWRDEEYRRRVHTGLSRVLDTAPTETRQIDDLRLVVFSDHHRGTGDRADDFRKCRKIYHAALGYYDSLEYRLLLLGDVEELWERLLISVIREYQSTLDLERRFFEAGRGVRFLGNHDEPLELPWNRSQIEKHIAGTALFDALRIEVMEGEKRLGDLLFAHGHQGVLYTWFHRFVVRRLWAPLQRLTGLGLGVPSSDHSLRQTHERAIYDWAVSREQALLLVCGHTHHPVFMSTAWEQTIRCQLENLKNAAADREAIARKQAELQWVMTDLAERKSSLPDGARPCYFNSGCCSFSDGDITGLEISDRKIRLVRWSGSRGHPQRIIMREANLARVLSNCDSSASQ
jgi:UDP-2,3-diacylglucosamine pyrophosphatase LpxH